MAWTRVVTSGHEVAVAEDGASGGQPYVLVHGIGVSARYYEPLATRLAGSGHVLTPDLPGFGRSPRPRQPLSVAGLARVVADVIAARGLSARVVVGHWQAARLTQTSMHEPARVNALMAADYARCGPRWYGASLPQMLGYRIEDRLRSVTAPVVVVRGAKDTVAPHVWTRHLARSPPTDGRSTSPARHTP